MKYLAWIPNREDESEGVEYDDDPRFVAETHAEACYYEDDCPQNTVVHVRRVGSDQLLIFDVWVEHDPTFHSSLRKDAL